MPRKVKQLKGPKLRVCAEKKCGATFKYSGKGRPFARCPKCRR